MKKGARITARLVMFLAGDVKMGTFHMGMIAVNAMLRVKAVRNIPSIAPSARLGT